MVDREKTYLKAELEKEEGLLDSTKEKLLNQLQRLKVEELALMKYLSLLNNPSLPTTSTATYFSQKDSSNTATEKDDEVNSVPLTGLSENLASYPLISKDHDNVEEEEEEDED